MKLVTMAQIDAARTQLNIATESLRKIVTLWGQEEKNRLTKAVETLLATYHQQRSPEALRAYLKHSYGVPGHPGVVCATCATINALLSEDHAAHLPL